MYHAHTTRFLLASRVPLRGMNGKSQAQNPCSCEQKPRRYPIIDTEVTRENLTRSQHAPHNPVGIPNVEMHHRHRCFTVVFLKGSDQVGVVHEIRARGVGDGE